MIHRIIAQHASLIAPSHNRSLEMNTEQAGSEVLLAEAMDIIKDLVAQTNAMITNGLPSTDSDGATGSAKREWCAWLWIRRSKRAIGLVMHQAGHGLSRQAHAEQLL